MDVRSRQIAAAGAALGWLAVIAFCIAGPVSGFGFTPNMTRFFDVILITTAVLTICATVGYVITPLVASHGIGVRAAMRAGRDRRPQGRHARDDSTEGSVVQLPVRR